MIAVSKLIPSRPSAEFEVSPAVTFCALVPDPDIFPDDEQEEAIKKIAMIKEDEYVIDRIKRFIILCKNNRQRCTYGCRTIYTGLQAY